MKVTKPEEMPKKAQWAIIEFEQNSVFIPGDERSRTNPGHGYPEHTETYDNNKLSVYDNEDEWRKACEDLMIKPKYSSPKKFVAFHIDSVATVTLKPVVEIK